MRIYRAVIDEYICSASYSLPFGLVLPEIFGSMPADVDGMGVGLTSGDAATGSAIAGVGGAAPREVSMFMVALFAGLSGCCRVGGTLNETLNENCRIGSKLSPVRVKFRPPVLKIVLGCLVPR